MFGPSQVATSISTRVVSSSTSERAPPITPAIDVGPSSSAIRTMSASSVRVAPSSVSTCSPSCARRTTSRCPATRSRSKACSGCPVSKHHVVGDVDDVGDRTHPGRGQPRLEPRRRGTDRHVLEHARGEARAQVGALDDDVGAVDRALGARVLGPRRRLERGTGRRMDLPGDAVDPQAVGAVGRDLELEHVVGDGDELGQRRARLRRVDVEHEDPVVVGADRELVLGEDHPLRAHAAQLGRLELRAVGHDRAGAGHGDGLARRRRWARRRRSARARPRPRRRGRRAGGRRPDAPRRPRRGRRRTPRSRPRRDGARGRPRCPSSPGARPARRRAGPRRRTATSQESGALIDHPNCARKRTSLSKNSRRSGTWCLSIAIRSIPMPKAKPWTRSGS